MSTSPCMPMLTPDQATTVSETLPSAVGAVRNFYNKAKTGNCPDAAPIVTVREVIGKFTKMRKTIQRPRKMAFLP